MFLACCLYPSCILPRKCYEPRGTHICLLVFVVVFINACIPMRGVVNITDATTKTLTPRDNAITQSALKTKRCVRYKSFPVRLHPMQNPCRHDRFCSIATKRLKCIGSNTILIGVGHQPVQQHFDGNQHKPAVAAIPIQPQNAELQNNERFATCDNLRPNPKLYCNICCRTVIHLISLT